LTTTGTTDFHQYKTFWGNAKVQGTISQFKSVYLWRNKGTVGKQATANNSHRKKKAPIDPRDVITVSGKRLLSKSHLRGTSVHSTPNRVSRNQRFLYHFQYKARKI